MFKNGKLVFFYSESLIHAGTGQGVGDVDLPIQRERITQWPIVRASSLKGALRDHFELSGCVNDDLFVIFGPDQDQKDSNNNAGKPDEHGGALSVEEAKILLFPVRSLKGTYAYVTCPLAVKRMYRDLLSLMAVGCNCVDDDIKSAAQMTVPDNQTILLPQDDLVSITVGNCGQPRHEVILEELVLEKQAKEEVAKLAAWLDKHWPSNSGAPWIDLDKRLAVVSDDVFKDFVELATEVITRNKIDDATGVVKKGALWNEECLPRETLMYGALFASDPGSVAASRAKVTGGLDNASKVLNYISDIKSPHVPKRLWVGGDLTIGRGCMKIQFAA